MSKFLRRLRLIVLRSPYETWDNDRVAKSFNDMVNLKRLGYGKTYPSGVLPVDTTDFFAHHILVYDYAQPNEPRLLMGYKSTNLSECRLYNLVFPGLSLVKSAGAKIHVEAMESVIGESNRRRQDIAYLGSWTIDPEVRSHPELKQALMEIFISSYCLFYEEQNISRIVLGGTLRFHTEKVFAQMGHRPLSLRGQDLPTIRVAHLVGEEVMVMLAEKFNLALMPTVERWRPLWEARELIGSARRDAHKRAG